MLAPAPPLPATSGVLLRMANLAVQLAGHVDLDVAALGSSNSMMAPTPYRVRDLPPPKGRLRSAAGSLRQPYLSARLSSKPMAELVARREWQTVQAELPFLVEAARGAALPIVLDAHNVEHLMARSMARAERNALARHRWTWEAAKIRRLEQTVASTVTAVCVTSEEDAEAFLALGASRVVVVPNGVDLDTHQLRNPDDGHDEATIVYLANFGYRPNELAALELVDEILPRIRRARPEARLMLVGREPTAAMYQRLGPRVEITGPVDDVGPYLRAATMTIVPLRAGGGTRLKILEAMACGIPVVATALAAAGLDVRDGEHLLVAERPQDLADRASALLDDPARAAALAAQARRLVEQRFGWPAVARPLIELHLELGHRG